MSYSKMRSVSVSVGINKGKKKLSCSLHLIPRKDKSTHTDELIIHFKYQKLKECSHTTHDLMFQFQYSL